MNNKKRIIISIVMLALACIYTLLVKFVDVKPIGPQDSMVGLSALNGAFSKLIGSHMWIYKLSELLGYVLLLLVVIYGAIGVYQLVKRKNLLKVDKQIIILGCFYVLMLIVYIFFEKVVINYRPVLMDGVLEASYPSSHTLLALCVGLSSLIVSQKYFNKKYIKQINLVTIILMSLVVLLRVLSGVHWISDIIGGIIISLALISVFQTAYSWETPEN